DLWRWQICHRGHPCGGIGSIYPRTDHGWVLRARMLRPALYDKCPSGAIPKPGKDAIVSKKPLKGGVCLLTQGVLIMVRCATSPRLPLRCPAVPPGLLRPQTTPVLTRCCCQTGSLRTPSMMLSSVAAWVEMTRVS